MPYQSDFLCRLLALTSIKPTSSAAAKATVPALDVLLYYITDRTQFKGDAAAQRRLLLAKIAEAARAGVDYIQLREKDLTSRELELLAGDALRAIREASVNSGRAAKFLINSRADVALAAGAAGVHLRSNDVSPEIVRQVWARCGAGPPARPVARAMLAVSCHSPREIRQAQEHGADFAVFGPVFEKKQASGIEPSGLAALREAAGGVGIPVFALGGITLQNAPLCIEAGAAGIAAIRLFQDNDVSKVVKTLQGNYKEFSDVHKP